jgi:hypothetical protein
MKRNGSFYIVLVFAVIIVLLLFSPEITSFLFSSQTDTSSSAKLDPLNTKPLKGEKQDTLANKEDKDQSLGPANDLYIPSEQDDQIPESDSFKKLLNRIESGAFKLEADDSEIIDHDFDNQKKLRIENLAKKLESFTNEFNSKISPNGQQVARPFSDPPLSPEKMEERKQIIKILTKENLTWDDFASPLIGTPVEKALSEGTALLKALDPKYSRTKFALLNYLKGLETIRSVSIKNNLLSPKETIDFIGSLDIKVTQSFIEERIGRTEYLIWRAISLTPFIEAAGGVNSVDYIPPFKTDVIVTSLSIKNNMINLPKGGKHRNWTINVEGLIEGQEASKLEIYHGKKLIKLMDLQNTDNKVKSVVYRKFNFSFTDDIGTSPYTIRALGEKGSYFQKSYSFISLPMKSFRRDAQGNPVIPNIMNLNLTQPPSRALDENIVIAMRSNYWNQSGAGKGVMQFSTFDTRIGRLRNF